MHSKKTTLLLGLIGISAQGCTVIPNFSADNYVAPLDGAKVMNYSTHAVVWMEFQKAAVRLLWAEFPTRFLLKPS